MKEGPLSYPKTLVYCQVPHMHQGTVEIMKNKMISSSSDRQRKHFPFGPPLYPDRRRRYIDIGSTKKVLGPDANSIQVKDAIDNTEVDSLSLPPSFPLSLSL